MAATIGYQRTKNDYVCQLESGLHHRTQLTFGSQREISVLRLTLKYTSHHLKARTAS